MDQRQMGEGLRKVPEERVRLGIDLLGIQANIVGTGQEPFVELTALSCSAGEQESIHEPEATDQKGTFTPAQAVIGLVGIVAKQVVAAPQPLEDNIDGKRGGGMAHASPRCRHARQAPHRDSRR
jgi:hypothetical protein